MSRFEMIAGLHSNALRDYSYDRYVDDEMEVDVEDDCISIDQFKRRTPPTVVPPTASPDYALNYPIVGASVSKDYKCPIIPDPTKRFILSMIVGAERIMDLGKCYAPFTSKNVVVTREGQALFKRLEIVGLTNQTRLDVYKSIVDVLTELFQGFHTPADIQHLVDLLNSGRKRVLYKIHPSVALHSDRGWVFLKAYEYVMHRADGVSRDLILLALPYLDTWRSMINVNHVLVETYGYANGAYDEDPPVDGYGNPLAWSENEKNLQSAKKFMDYIRNGTSHRLQRSIRLSADQFETLLLVIFHMLLPKLLEAMFDHLNADGLRKAGLLR